MRGLENVVSYLRGCYRHGTLLPTKNLIKIASTAFPELRDCNGFAVHFFWDDIGLARWACPHA